MSQASKFITLNTQNGSKSKTTILMLEGRAKRELGVGSDPALAILHHYNQYFHSSKGSSGWANTYMPAIGVEIIGTEVRYTPSSILTEPACMPVLYSSYGLLTSIFCLRVSLSMHCFRFESSGLRSRVHAQLRIRSAGLRSCNIASSCACLSFVQALQPMPTQ